MVALLIVVITLQTLFTAAVRLCVVPMLTPAVHMHSGLQWATDSEFFHGQAAALSQQLRQQGWSALRKDLDGGLLHVKILASIYYLAGRDSPYIVYLVNVLAAAISALLLFALGRGIGLGRWAAAGGSALMVTGPMFLFVHSELLREPFIILSFQTFVLGLWMLIRTRERREWRRDFVRQSGGAILCALGFVAVSLFRPYLMVPVLLSLGVTLGLCLLLPLVGRSPQRVGALQTLLMGATLVGLTTGFVIPQMNDVRQYSQVAASESKIQEVEESSAEAWQRLRKKIDASGPDARSRADAPLILHSDVMIPSVCAVRWQASRFLPAVVDRKAESLACAREAHLLFCNADLLDHRADRRCDQTSFASASDVVGHTPAALLWSVAVPYPNMWLEGFGSGGTGLRRTGYVVDGVVAYALLPGLFGLVWHWRRRPDVLALAAGLLVIHLIYGLGVPSQFILARMRLSMYLPLLITAVYGWTLMLGRLMARVPPSGTSRGLIATEATARE